MVEMETKRNSSVSKETTNSPGFMTLLSLAACEWLLIFLMFVDAALSYFLTKLAGYCELPPPCILCARIEHVLGNEKAGNYRNLLCTNHKAEISCLMSCQIHDKLANVNLMCEECYMSIAMQNKSNPESYKPLVGKLGLTFDGYGSQDQLTSSNSKGKPCSCCNKTWRSKPNMQRLLNRTPSGFGASRANIRPPLPRAPFRSRFSRRDSMRTKMRDNIVGSVTSSRRMGNNNAAVDPLSHVGYTELRINSDSESEFPFSDDDDVGIVDPKERVAVHGVSDLFRSQSDPTMGDMNLQDSDSGTSVRDSVRHDARKRNKPNNAKNLAAKERMELKSEKPNSEPTPSASPELISLADSSPSKERTKIDISRQSNDLETPLEVSSEKYAGAAAKEEQLSELLSTTAIADVLNYAANPLMSNGKDLPDLGKLVLNNKGRDLSGMLAQQTLLSNRETDLSSTSSPRTYIGLQDALRRSDPSMFDSILTGQRSGSVERNDPGYESLDGSSVSEIEGESVVDKLKRQVEYDRRCMSSLCKELEEERSASAIAANQAMAMITRLQEEKASLHMEALQYLRMMEEQSEYDMDALEKANDVIAEKEKQIQDLETELDFFKMNYLDESKEENTAVNDGVDSKNNDNDENAPPLESTSTKVSEERTGSVNLQSPILDFEDEKMYITQRLKSLETKLCQAKSNGDVGNDDEKNNFDCEGNNDKYSDSNGKKGSVDSIENEISEINERLEALESDRYFLEHAFNSLRNGNEGLQFIQDIARQLQELRKTECQKGQSGS